MDDSSAALSAAGDGPPARSPVAAGDGPPAGPPHGPPHRSPVGPGDGPPARSPVAAGDGPPHGRARRWADVEPSVFELAARQHGIATRAQLLAAGASADAIDRRIAAGWLAPIHRGVYRVGPVGAPRSREMAAVLACGTGAVVSHLSAAALWQQVRPRDAIRPVEVALSRTVRRRPGLRIHRLCTLLAGETTRLDGIPITTPERTLCDIAACIPERELERAVAETVAGRIATRSSILKVLARHPGHRGARRLHGILAAETPPARTRSEAEEIFVRLVRRARLPAPDANVVIKGYEVDFRWRTEGLIVEVDGYAYHSSKRKFEGDRRRDADLSGVGYTVMRVTWDQLRDEPEAVLARLVRALERRGRR